EPRRERLLHQPDALDERESPPPSGLAALKIADRRLQITGYGFPRAVAAPCGSSICEGPLHGRYVKIALTIAGSDSGGGAGIQADLKTFHQFGVFGTSVVTAVTAQNTVGVRAWEAVPVALVTKQLDALADDLPPLAVKRAGRALVKLGARAALVEGGHLTGDAVVDVLVAGGTVQRFTRPRIDTTSTHGTGCTLSAAVAAGLAHGRPLERAVADALDFV